MYETRLKEPPIPMEWSQSHVLFGMVLYPFNVSLLQGPPVRYDSRAVTQALTLLVELEKTVELYLTESLVEDTKGSHAATHKKCIGTEVRTRQIHIKRFVLEMCRRFRKLGTPISSHDPFACAVSTSSRVGATTNCKQRLEAPSRSVLKTLMSTCNIVSYLATRLQSSWRMVVAPFMVLPSRVHANKDRVKFSEKIVTVSAKQVHSTTFLRFRFVRKVMACVSSSMTLGNQGARSSTVPNRGNESPTLVPSMVSFSEKLTVELSSEAGAIGAIISYPLCTGSIATESLTIGGVVQAAFSEATTSWTSMPYKKDNGQLVNMWIKAL